MTDTQFQILRQISLFGALSDDTLRFLVQRVVNVECRSGEYFFHEGDQAQSLYVLEYGQVSVLKHWQGHDYLLSQFGPGDCFGEMALIDMHTRSASVLALEDSRAFKVSATAIMELYQHNLEQFTLLQMNMGREVSRRLREASERIFELQVRSGLDTPHLARRYTEDRRQQERRRSV